MDSVELVLYLLLIAVLSWRNKINSLQHRVSLITWTYLASSAMAFVTASQ